MAKTKAGRLAILCVAGLVTAFIASSNAGNGQLEKKPCCIAGDYSGSFKFAASATCFHPESDTFTMQIVQGEKCDSAVSATAVRPHDPVPLELTGTVAPNTSKRCCDLNLHSSNEHETIDVKICLTRNLMGKWSGKGTVVQKKVHDNKKETCSGEIEITQK